MLHTKELQYSTDLAPTTYCLSLKLFHIAVPLANEEGVFLLNGTILCNFCGREEGFCKKYLHQPCVLLEPITVSRSKICIMETDVHYVSKEKYTCVYFS